MCGDLRGEEMKIDVGCGKTWKRTQANGFAGIDKHDFGQEYVLDVRDGLPFSNETVDEARSEHFLEHLTRDEAVAFLNEMWRVLKRGAVFHVIVPYGLHPKAYVLTHRSFWTPETFKDLARPDRWNVYGIRRWRVGKAFVNKRDNIHAFMEPIK